MTGYGDYVAHPAADLFPLMEGTDFDELVADIRENGQHDPIEVLSGTDEILDGRNRYRAAVAAGMMPVVNLVTCAEPYTYVISKNVHRRHLTTGQRAAIGTEAAPKIAEEVERHKVALAREQVKREPRDADGSFKKSDEPVPDQVGPEPVDDHPTRTQTAKAVDVNPRDIQRAEYVKKHDAELYRRVQAGEMTLPAAERGVKIKAADPDLWAEVEAGRVKSTAAEKIIKERKREAEQKPEMPKQQQARSRFRKPERTIDIDTVADRLAAAFVRVLQDDRAAKIFEVLKPHVGQLTPERRKELRQLLVRISDRADTMFYDLEEQAEGPRVIEGEAVEGEIFVEGFDLSALFGVQDRDVDHV